MNDSMDAVFIRNGFRRLGIFGLVAAQFLLAAAIFLTTRFDPMCVGCFAVCFVGSLIAIWAWFTMGLSRLRVMPNPSARTVLLETGPYRQIRHPMYSGLLIAAFGLMLTDPQTWRAVTWILLVIVLIAKVLIEEKMLRAHFPQYATYCNRTWRFLPWLF